TSSNASRMVSMVLANFCKSSLAGDALRVRRVDRRNLAESGAGSPRRPPHCLPLSLDDGFCEIPLAVRGVDPAGAESRTEYFVARADRNGRRCGRGSLYSNCGACYADGATERRCGTQ